jgi:hypothetical protein
MNQRQTTVTHQTNNMVLSFKMICSKMERETGVLVHPTTASNRKDLEDLVSYGFFPDTHVLQNPTPQKIVETCRKSCQHLRMLVCVFHDLVPPTPTVKR